MNIQTVGVDAWVAMLVNCKECETPLSTTSERIKGLCDECQCLINNPDAFDPYGQPILEEVAA